MWVNDLANLGITKSNPMYDLLVTDGALSTALRARCNILSVQVIKQELATATTLEQQFLNIAEPASFVREVFLLGDDQPLVQARAVFPLRTYHKFQNILDNLGNKLLGETFLYTMRYKKTALQYSMLEGCISRRALFELQGYTLMVTEKFLDIGGSDLQLDTY